MFTKKILHHDKLKHNDSVSHKKFIVALLLAIVGHSSATEKEQNKESISMRWVQQQSNLSDVNFRAVHAVSSEVAWISGSKSTLLRTLDGGKKWELLKIPATKDLDFRAIA